MKIHREGYPHIAFAIIVWLAGLYVSFIYLRKYLVLLILLVASVSVLLFWVIWFFRLPQREMTKSKKFLVSPADGKIVVIEETFEPEYFKDKRLQVSIFMSPMDVHVNRSPINGEVKYVKYHKGKYLVAWHPKSSTENERSSIVIGNDDCDILLRQIAGAVARRVCVYVHKSDFIVQTEEFGFIRFGSRVDLFLPLGTKMKVNIGDKVLGGVTILATDVVDKFKKIPEEIS